MNKNDVIRYFENQGWGEWTAEEFEAFYNNDRNTCYFMERCAELDNEEIRETMSDYLACLDENDTKCIHDLASRLHKLIDQYDEEGE